MSFPRTCAGCMSHFEAGGHHYCKDERVHPPIDIVTAEPTGPFQECRALRDDPSKCGLKGRWWQDYSW